MKHVIVLGAGRVGGAMARDLAPDFKVTVADNASLNPSANVLSIAAWVKTIAANKPILSKGTSGTSGYELSVGGSAAVFKKFAGTDVTLSGNTAINDGAWHHVAAVANASGMFIYVDGKLDNSNANTTNFTASAASLLLGSSSASAYFSGNLDEAAVYNYALSASEIGRPGNKSPVLGTTTFN
jgi:hypothetical protein